MPFDFILSAKKEENEFECYEHRTRRSSTSTRTLNLPSSDSIHTRLLDMCVVCYRVLTVVFSAHIYPFVSSSY